MSDPRRVLLAGATGLVGSRVMELAIEQPWLRLVALSRREAPMPRGVRMEMLVADPAGWPEAIGRAMTANGFVPDLTLCSTAVRAHPGDGRNRACRAQPILPLHGGEDRDGASVEPPTWHGLSDRPPLVRIYRRGGSSATGWLPIATAMIIPGQVQHRLNLPTGRRTQCATGSLSDANKCVSCTANVLVHRFRCEYIGPKTGLWDDSYARFSRT